MLSFLQYTAESKQLKTVHRIDPNLINDFEKTPKTYYHTSDWTASGDSPEGLPVNDIKKSTGLFAGEKKHIAPFAVTAAAGRDAKFITTAGKGRPNLVIDKKTHSKLKTGNAFLSSFAAPNFSQTHSGEYFSGSPGKTTKQQRIRNVPRFLKRHFNVNVVDDIDAHHKHLKATDPDSITGAEGF